MTASSLQIGAFNTHEQAVEFAQKVRSSGYQADFAEQIVPGLGTRHQVRSGLYDTYLEAYIALGQIEKELDIVGITVPVDIPLEQ